MPDFGKIREAEALLTQGDTLRSQGRDAEAEPLYLRAVSILETAAGAMDVRVAEGCLRLADLNRFFYLNAEAVPLYHRARTVFEAALGPTHPRVAEVLARLGDACGEDDDLPTLAREHYKRALEIIEKNLGEGRTLLDARPDLLAVFYEQEGRYADSESLHEWVLTILTEQFGPGNLRVAAQMLRLGQFRGRRGQFEECGQLLRQALTIAEAALGPEHPGLRSYLHELAARNPVVDPREIWGLGPSSGQWTPRMQIARENETLYLRALAIAEKNFGTDHPAVVKHLEGLESHHRGLNREGEATAIRRRILAIIDRVGPDKRFWALEALLRLREPSRGTLSADADALFHRARALAEEGVGADDMGRNATLFRLAQLCLNEGRDGEAAELFVRTRAMAEGAFGPAHPRVACVLLQTGLSYVWRKSPEAQRYYDEALDMLRLSSTVDDPRIAGELLLHAHEYHRAPRLAEAFQSSNAGFMAGLRSSIRIGPSPGPNVEPFLQMLLARVEGGLGRNHPIAGDCLLALGDLRVEQGAELEAEELFLRALAIAEKAPGTDRDGELGAVAAVSGLAMLYHVQKKYAEAEPLYRRWLADCERHPGPQENNLFTPLFNLARCLADQGRQEEIEPLVRRGRAIADSRRASGCIGLGLDSHWLMKFYRLLDRDAEEEALAREELSSNVALWGQDHPFVETPTRDLAEICRRQGKFVEAEQLYRRALATCEADLGPDGGTRLTPLLTGLGRVYLDQGRHADAEPLLLRAIKILEDARQRDPEEDSWLLSALEDYVSLLQREARAAEVPEVESRLASVKALVGAERVQRARHAVRDRLALD